MNPLLSSLPSNRPTWPLTNGWWLVGAERAWRLDQPVAGEKHYFMVMKPDTPYWRVGLFLPDHAEQIVYWLTKLGYILPPDFPQRLSQSQAWEIPVGMIQFSLHPTGQRIKLYHATDSRGHNRSFEDSWDILHSLNPSLDAHQPFPHLIEGLAIQGQTWEYYTHPDTPMPTMPHKPFTQAMAKIGAQCRQQSIDSKGVTTWYYTHMTKDLNPDHVLDALATCTPLDKNAIQFTRDALEKGAYWGDIIVQSPTPNTYIPIADLLWPINAQKVFAP